MTDSRTLSSTSLAELFNDVLAGKKYSVERLHDRLCLDLPQDSKIVSEWKEKLEKEINESKHESKHQDPYKSLCLAIISLDNGSFCFNKTLEEIWKQINDDALFGIGYIHETRGSYKTAWDWYTAAQKNPDTQNYKVLMYLKGRTGLPINKDNDKVAADVLRTESASLGHAFAQFNLGLLYKYGRGVEQSDLQAFIWFCKSANQGCSAAQNSVGELYEKGRGVLQNFNSAVEYYLKSAEQKNDRGQYNLGRMYASGQGIARDPVMAARLFRMSLDQGFKRARNDLALIVSQLPEVIYIQGIIFGATSREKKLAFCALAKQKPDVFDRLTLQERDIDDVLRLLPWALKKEVVKEQEQKIVPYITLRQHFPADLSFTIIDYTYHNRVSNFCSSLFCRSTSQDNQKERIEASKKNTLG